MTMMNALVAPSWQFDVAAAGNVRTIPTALPRGSATIAEGAITDFPAPCPPERQNYVYRIEVMAMAPNGASLGYGWAFASAQSLLRQLDAERLRRIRIQKARDEAAAKGLPPPSEQPEQPISNPQSTYNGAGYPRETTAYFFVY